MIRVRMTWSTGGFNLVFTPQLALSEGVTGEPVLYVHGQPGQDPIKKYVGWETLEISHEEDRRVPR